MVVHGGGVVSGTYIHSLMATDIKSGWTEGGATTGWSPTIEECPVYQAPSSGYRTAITTGWYATSTSPRRKEVRAMNHRTENENVFDIGIVVSH